MVLRRLYAFLWSTSTISHAPLKGNPASAETEVDYGLAIGTMSTKHNGAMTLGRPRDFVGCFGEL